MKIPYGQSNFENISTKNYYYVDRTPHIEVLENLNEKFLVFLRPRRFGKSLFCSMLNYYYDVQYKNRFKELFGKYYSGKNPTAMRNNYLVLNLDFSGMGSKTKEDVLLSFNESLIVSIKTFLFEHNIIDKDDEISALFTKKYPADIIASFFQVISKNSEKKIYIIIDEYDMFANELLAFKPDEFKKLFGSTGFVRKFYEKIKIGTKDGIVDRVFITGVTPIALDSLSSGFNITTNLSNSIKFNEMMGFTTEEVKAIAKEICMKCPTIDNKKLLSDLQSFYDGYKFSKNAKKQLFNPDMVLYFANDLLREGMCKYPDNLIDKNIVSDYTKIQQMFKIGDYEKNLEVIDDLLKKGEVVSSLIDAN